VSLVKKARTAPAPVLNAQTAEGLTDEQLHGRQCWRDVACAPPYTPAGHAYTQPAQPGAPLGWAIVACERHSDAGHLPRFVAARMGNGDPYPGLWGVWDRQAAGWVDNGGDVERYGMRQSAEAWLAGRRYMDEFGRTG
jgi:hypothetical protein